MKLSKQTTIRLTSSEANIIGHMNYMAVKYWNTLNYERLHYREPGFESMPDWYKQKKTHKNDFFARNLPSQTAQEIAKQLDKSWKSYFTLLRTGGIENPKPPKFKHDKIPVTYMQNGIKRVEDNTLRLSLPKQLKEHMKAEYGIDDNYLFLSNPVFEGLDDIKQLKLYPPEDNGEMKAVVIYEVEDVEAKEENANYLSIDPGLNNILTCYNNRTGETFILGKQLFSIERKYLKRIAYVQSRWYSVQAKAGVEHPKSSKHIQKLYSKMNSSLDDYTHKMTKSIVSYCIQNNINTVVCGDISHIRDNFNKGNVLNQKMHSWPFRRIIGKLEYKLTLAGITLVMEKESYSSQCSPLSEEVSKKYAEKNKRVKRGLFVDGEKSWNADTVGAYNILRLYKQRTGKQIQMAEIRMPYVYKVAV